MCWSSSRLQARATKNPLSFQDWFCALFLGAFCLNIVFWCQAVIVLRSPLPLAFRTHVLLTRILHYSFTTRMFYFFFSALIAKIFGYKPKMENWSSSLTERILKSLTQSETHTSSSLLLIATATITLVYFECLFCVCDYVCQLCMCVEEGSQKMAFWSWFSPFTI